MSTIVPETTVMPATKAPKAKVAPAPVAAPAPEAKTTKAAPVTAPAPVIPVQQPTVAPAVVAAPAAAVPEKKPAPSGINIETSQLVKSIGMMLLGGGIIAATIWYFGVDMIVMALYIALPIVCLLVGLRLISSGTLQLIWNGELAERVDAYVKSLGGPQPPKTATT